MNTSIQAAEKDTAAYQEATRFLELLDPSATSFTFQTFDDNKATAKDKSLTRVLHGSLEKCWPELCRLNALGAGIYVTVNETDGDGRTAENIVRIRAVIEDQDTPYKAPVDYPIAPHIEVESSPGKYQRYWLVDGLPPAEWPSIQRLMIARYGSDPAVKDICRVMRLPGSLHLKNRAQPHRVHITKIHVAPPYSAAEVIAAFPPAAETDVNGKAGAPGQPGKQKPLLGVVHNPVLQALEACGHLIGKSSSGGWQILCPWNAEHSTGNDGTAYFEPHTKGYTGHGFKCQHSHCVDRTTADLMEWLGFFPRETATEMFAGVVPGENGVHHPAGLDDEPEPFDREIPRSPWPDDCLPPGMHEAAQAIAEHVQAPVALSGMAVVAAVAHITQRLVDARHPKTGAIPSSLFILTEGKSGDRKSACFKLATAPLAKREREERERHKAEVKQLERQAEQAKPKDRAAILGQVPADPRTIFTDSTTQKIEQVFINGSAPALSLSTDEGGTLLSGHSLKAETRSASLSALTRLFDGSGVQRDRIGEGQSGFRYGIRFGLFLSAQPIVLREALSDPLMRGQGFLPRFLYSAPDSLAGGRFVDSGGLSRQANDDPRITGYWRVLQALDELPVMTDEHGGLSLPMVGMDVDAVAVWLRLYNDTEARQGVDGDLHTLGAFASRAGELAVRVATVYACWSACWTARWDGTDMTQITITGADMRQAAALVRHSLAEWLRQGDGATLSAVEQDARDLLGWLHQKGLKTVTRSYVARNCPNRLRKDKARRNAAINELIRRHWLIEADGHLAVNEKPKASPATATSAIFAIFGDGMANGMGVLGRKSSRSRRSRSRNPAPPFFNPEPAPRKRAGVGRPTLVPHPWGDPDDSQATEGGSTPGAAPATGATRLPVIGVPDEGVAE